MSILKTIGISYFLLILCFDVSAGAVEHSPRLKTIMDYEIGGGYIADPPTTIATSRLLDIGAGWDLNLDCGQLDLSTSVKNQLNGVTDGFKTMMDNVVHAATGAISSLPALILQRANPALYDMLQQGILQGKMDFEFAKTSCEDVSRMMEESLPFAKLQLAIKSQGWAKEINNAGGDAIRAKNEMDNIKHGNDGVQWACGVNKGGEGQEPIRTLSDVIHVGYNVMFDRLDSCDTSTISAAIGQGTPLWEYWNGPIAAANWSRRVLGDELIRTCDGCKKLQNIPGKGLTYLHREMADEIRNDLSDLVSGSMQLTWQNLNRVSAPPGVFINDTIVMAIRKRDAQGQSEMIKKLAGEIAYTRLIEQGRLLTQLITIGSKEPNIEATEQIRNAINESLDKLQVELELIEHEMTARQSIAKNTINRIIGFDEQSTQNIRLPVRGKASAIDQFGNPN